MSVMLVNLRGVPEDEAQDMRNILRDHDIEFFETPPGNWGISMPALWVHDEAAQQRALPLLDQYQQERYRSARAEFEQRRRQRQQAPFSWTRFTHRLIQGLIFVALAFVVLYLSVKPFLDLGK